MGYGERESGQLVERGKSVTNTTRLQKLTKLFQITHTHGHWQRNRDDIEIDRVLGEGNFGSVCLGTMIDPTRTTDKVAIKTIKVSYYD